ncbi:MAG: type IV secretory system conjugative DNA transfer family protein [Bacilli bacterium]|nr:type IV secretory system conjugative DNA transfer family protein [Bacilli bacterium]
MSYARWATKEELLSKLEKVEVNKKIDKSGIPLAYEENNLYIDNNVSHNLVIGSTGSGKTQTTILPMINLAISAKESIVVNDPLGELYEINKEKLQKEGYEVAVLNFNKPDSGISWNPLDIPQKLYDNGDKDKASKMIEDIAYYIFTDTSRKEVDPFWVNSTINYFTGLTLYLFENSKENINLLSLIDLKEQIEKEGSKKFIEKIDKNSVVYKNLSSILLAPPETRGSILSVFTVKIKNYISREKINNMLSNSSFDIKSINKKPTAFYIISDKYSFGNSLIPLLINQIIDSISLEKENNIRVNIFLDEFDFLVPIKDFSRLIEYTRRFNVRITAVIKSYTHLYNMYTKEEVELLKMCFGNIVYLLSNDIYTLEEISRQCGNKSSKKEPLITPEELKTLDIYEAIILMPRMMPIRTKLLPNYEINWD